ncbi:MAG: Gfo/Idh/MocA family oxidoreductase, partial [Candidatus Brocadiales bacterium]
MVEKKLKTAVVGVGHLGKEHARVYSRLPDAELVGVVDIDEQQGKAVAQRLGTQYYPNLDGLDDKAAAVSVVVPTSAHFEIASHFLNRGIPVLLEKPMAGNVDEAMALVDLSVKTDTLLQVGYIERFNP